MCNRAALFAECVNYIVLWIVKHKCKAFFKANELHCYTGFKQIHSILNYYIFLTPRGVKEVDNKIEEEEERQNNDEIEYGTFGFYPCI